MIYNNVAELYERYCERCEREEVEHIDFDEFYDNWIDENMED